MDFSSPLLLELIIGFGRNILCSMLGTTCRKYEVEVHSVLGTLLELQFALFCSILKWSVGNNLLRSEVAQAFSPRRRSQSCYSVHQLPTLMGQDLWSTLAFLIVAHESLKWMLQTLRLLETAVSPGGFDLAVAVGDIAPQGPVYRSSHFFLPQEKLYLMRFYRLSLSC